MKKAAPAPSANEAFPFVENLGSGSAKAGFSSALSPSQITSSSSSTSSNSFSAQSEFDEGASLDTTVESASSVSSFFSPNDTNDSIAPSSSALAERLKLLKPLTLQHVRFSLILLISSFFSIVFLSPSIILLCTARWGSHGSLWLLPSPWCEYPYSTQLRH